MKKLIIPAILALLFTTSCGGKKTSEKETTSEPETTTTTETTVSEDSELSSIKDSVVAEIEEAKTDIEESVEKLDNALNELK